MTVLFLQYDRAGPVKQVFGGSPIAALREDASTEPDRRIGGERMSKYAKFGLMIAVSTAVMWALMYLNTYELDHVYFSQTRSYMALMMGAAMAIVMLAFMQPMYTDRRVNIAIFVGSAGVLALALWLVRSQATVGEVSWMKAMIPHHSIAILTSERAHIEDPRARDLAERIIVTQRKEIEEMKALIDDLESP